MKQDLKGLTVVVTRPLDQAGGLAQAVQTHLGEVVLLPTLEIAPLKNDRAQKIAHIKYDYMIFTSRNAVIHSGLDLKNFNTTTLLAIGPATARALAQCCIDQVIITPEQFDSEHLLHYFESINLVDKKILIVTGKGGRGYLAEQLPKKGALVDNYVVYERTLPRIPKKELQQLINLRNCVVVSTSCESLANLITIIQSFDAWSWLLKTPIIVISQRMANYALQQGFDPELIIQSTAATDDAILECLIKWYAISLI